MTYFGHEDCRSVSHFGPEVVYPSGMPAEEKPLTARDIADKVLEDIASGTLEPGQRLGSTEELATRFRVSNKTVYRAVGLLKTSGELMGQQGRGVYVRDVDPLEWRLHQFERGDRRDDHIPGWDDWKAAAAELGREPSQDIPRVSVEPAPPNVAAWLGVEAGTHVVARRRVRRVDGEPFQLADSWFTTSIALDTDLMKEEDVSRPGGILAYIGRPQVRVRDELRSWPALTPAEAERLEMKNGAGKPVIRHARIGYGDDGQPVRVMVTVAPGHLNTLVYEMEV